MFRRKLAKTLREIANGNANTFYSGNLSDDIVSDIKEYGRSNIGFSRLFSIQFNSISSIFNSLSSGATYCVQILS